MRSLVLFIVLLIGSPALGQQLKAITNSIEMKLVLIHRGSFTMGSPVDEVGRMPIETSHEVTLSKSYYLGVYEVTQGEYEKVMGSNPSTFNGARNPVETVSWNDAVSFCRKLSEIPEEKAAGREYRLPTEAEWEYACRTTSTTSYSFGETAESLGDSGWIKENAGNKTHPVGEKKPNRWGLYDMHGNVSEWSQDWFGDYPLDASTDPQGSNGGKYRVDRGGSWDAVAENCRSAFRGISDPPLRTSSFGFRVALSPSVKQPEAEGAETSVAKAPVSNAITEPTKAPSTEKMSPGVPSRENLEARIDRLKPELLRKEAEIVELRKQGKKAGPQLDLEVRMLRRGEQSGK